MRWLPLLLVFGLTFGRAPSEPAGPFLIIEKRAGVVSSADAQRAWKTSAAYVWQNMSQARRGALHEELAEVRDGLETLGNPFAIDLGDETPEENLKSLRKQWMTHLTAARGLTVNHWTTPDGMTVRAAARCPESANCVSAWRDDQSNPATRQARFAAWQVSASAVISSADARKAMNLLVNASEDPSSAIALVLSGAPTKRVEISEFAKLAKEVAELIERKGKTKVWSPALATAPDYVPHPSWLRLQDDEVMIVPKMHDIARLHEFRDELARRLDEASIDWRFVRPPER